MKVGVKFCGGCNPRYDRGNFYRKVKQENPSITFEVAEEDVNYDYMLVICGCPSCCASYNQYTFENLIMVWEKDANVDFALEKRKTE